MQSRAVAAVAAASLLAMVGGGVALKLSTSPAHAACSSGGGIAGGGGVGDGGPIQIGGRAHHHFDFGQWRGHNAQVIHAAYLGRFSHPYESPAKQGGWTERFVLLPTGTKQGRFLAR